MKTLKNHELLVDIRFLAERASQAGTCSFREDRNVGASSNSIVNIAYGISTRQVLPRDKDDLKACERMWEKLPSHRKTVAVVEAMQGAREAIS